MCHTLKVWYIFPAVWHIYSYKKNSPGGITGTEIFLKQITISGSIIHKSVFGICEGDRFG